MYRLKFDLLKIGNWILFVSLLFDSWFLRHNPLWSYR
jgi:hypothetical protein